MDSYTMQLINDLAEARERAAIAETRLEMVMEIVEVYVSREYVDDGIKVVAGFLGIGGGDD